MAISTFDLLGCIERMSSGERLAVVQLLFQREVSVEITEPVQGIEGISHHRNARIRVLDKEWPATD